jgi:hypothetical protein
MIMVAIYKHFFIISELFAFDSLALSSILRYWEDSILQQQIIRIFMSWRPICNDKQSKVEVQFALQSHGDLFRSKLHWTHCQSLLFSDRILFQNNLYLHVVHGILINNIPFWNGFTKICTVMSKLVQV